MDAGHRAAFTGSKLHRATLNWGFQTEPKSLPKVVLDMPRTLLLLTVLIPSLVHGQTDRPGYLPREVRARLIPGVRAAYTRGESVDVRVDRLPALFVAKGSSPTPFLAGGPFRTSFTGYLQLRLRGDFEIKLAGSGTASLAFDGKAVIEAGPGDLAEAKPVTVSLLKGYNAIRLEYASPKAGDATLRVYWRSDEFPWEPLPVDRLWCDGEEESLALGMAHRRGRELFGNRMCLRCHESPVEWRAESFAGLPELERDAPSLVAAGNRLQSDWIREWLRDPTSVRNEVTMPSLLHGFDDAEAATTANDLAAYLLAAKTGPAPMPIESTEELVDRGELLYETRGCLACHRFTPPTEEDEFDRVSLHFAGEKYKPGALAAFLRDTRAHYGWSRMPKFDFDANDAAALEVFLRSRAKGRLGVVPAGDAARGRERFTKLGCVRCHVAEPGARVPAADVVALGGKRTAGGCLAESPPKDVPDFRFDDESRLALQRFLATEARDDSLRRVVPAEFSRRVVAAVDCTACHSRDDDDARLPLLAAEEGELGLLADQVPGLTWVGEKLKPAWSKRLFAGTLGYRLRDHFRTRMPAFPARGDLLAEGLSAEHGFDHRDEPTVEFDAKLAEIGRAVSAPQTGLSCIRCHPIADQPPTAPEQALSTNLSFTRGRMREEFYTRWMLFPQRIEPNTRMIRFAPDGRRTGLDSIYEADAAKQFDSVWHWLGRLHDERLAVESGNEDRE